MESFKDCFEKLKELENFDPEAFIQGKAVGQDVCNFVLALALVYNDSKNLNLLLLVIGKNKPEGAPQIKKEWGEYRALTVFIFRLHIGLIHELFELIRSNQKVLEDSFFKKVIKNLRRIDREAWGILVNVALNKKIDSGRLHKALLFIRNKISFHYDLKEVFKGFREFFVGPPPISTTKPLMSRGNSMNESRYYFADASAEQYLRSCLESKNLSEFQNEVETLLDKLNFALFRIVQTFIQKRGFGWRQGIK